MEIESTPEFYTGAPVDPVDLRFRGAFVADLWRTLRTGHVVLTAPRRTGKTSVMDYLRDHPENGVLGGVDQRSGLDAPRRLLPGAARWIP